MLEKNTCKSENGVLAEEYPLFSVAQSIKMNFLEFLPNDKT